MKVQPTTQQLIAMLYERLPELFDRPQRKPLTFEQWLAMQHGDPEELGFLQALRIAYIAGQDSITKDQK